MVEEICDQIQAGQVVDLDSLIEGHADIADRLRHIYPTLLAMANWDPLNLNKTGADGEANPQANRALGDFRILRQIGRGGMGIVYEAEQMSVHRAVALKVLPLASLLDDRALARFRNEVRAAATLDHPNIVTVYSVGEERGIHYYAMQLVRGQSLARVVQELRTRNRKNDSVTGHMIDRLVSDIQAETIESRSTVAESIAEPGLDQFEDAVSETRACGGSGTNKITDLHYFRNVVRLFIQAAEALQHAHEHGIVHRDVKPGNLLLDKSGRLYITDFGLARIEAGDGVTLTGDVIGTLRYMSPEQVLAGRVLVDHRTDIYSLGATLYELATLQPIWSGPDRADLIRRITFDEPLRPHRINPTFPRDLETIILKSITKNPSERYDSAQAFADDLQRFLDNKPVLAKRTTTVQRLNKWTRRNPAIMWSAVILIIITAIASTVSAGLLWREQNRTAQAAQNEKQARKRAELRLAQLVKGNEILGSIFEDLNIDSIHQGDEPLEAVLARRLANAARQIEGESIGDPLVVADMQYRLAGSLLSLGFPNEAIHPFQKCLAARSERLEVNHSELLETMNGLSGAYFEAGQLDEALSLQERVYELRKAELGDDHPDTLISANNLTGTYLRLGQVDKALLIAEKTLERTIEALGPLHSDTVLSMHNLALVFQKAGQLDKAVRMFEDSQELHQRVYGREHPGTLNNMANLASAYRETGQPDKAVRLFEETMELQKANLGPKHPSTLNTMNGLAVAYKDAGQMYNAISMGRKTLELRTAKLGPEHPDTLVSKSNLAKAYKETGDVKKAIRLLEETMELRKTKLGVKNPATLRNINDLALMYKEIGDVKKAIRLLEETVELGKTKLGVENPQTIRSINDLAMMYSDNGRLDNALPMFEEAVNVSSARLGPHHPHTLIYMNNLAIAYNNDDQLDKAMPMSEHSLEKHKANLGLDHPSTLVSMNTRALVYHAVGQLDKAIPLFEETLKAMRAKLGADHSNTMTVMKNLASAYSTISQLDKAIPLYEQVLELRETKLGPEHFETLNVMDSLAAAYKDDDQLDKAVPLYERVLELRKIKIGTDDAKTLDSMFGLALTLRSTGQYAKAVPLLEEVLKLKKIALGPDHRITLTSQAELGITYKYIGRLDESLRQLEDAQMASKTAGHKIKYGAELVDVYVKTGNFDSASALADEVLDTVRSHLPADCPELARQLAVLSKVYFLPFEAYADAETELKASLAIYEKALPDNWRTFETQSLLGHALVGQKKYAEAEPILLAGYQGLVDRETLIPPLYRSCLRESLERLVKLYEAWDLDSPADGYDLKADEWRQKLESSLAPSPDSTDTK